MAESSRMRYRPVGKRLDSDCEGSAAWPSVTRHVKRGIISDPGQPWPDHGDAVLPVCSMENLEMRNRQRVGLANGKACIANDVAQISNQALEKNPKRLDAPPDVGATMPAADCGV
ncbi:hypothetical protein PG997_008397 [Apiospora hydei]|uniref:Uncharacterized protein n=1 Tax=Apiospora hydei TaxID=1337664 RepID=A0ABR1WAQ7_9PEZI